MNENIGLFVAVLAIVGIIIALIVNTHKQLTPNNYVVNSYLYIILAILLVSFLILIMKKYNLGRHINSMAIFGVLILSIIVLFAMYMIDVRQTVLRHILWVVFIVCIAIIIFPVALSAEGADVLWKSIITVIIVVLLLTYIASRFPRDAFNSWGTYLSVGLVALIIFGIIDFILPGHSSTRAKIFGILIILLFSAYVLYDTNIIYQHAQIASYVCGNTTNQLTCADYPGESLALFLDIINLFSGTVSIQTA